MNNTLPLPFRRLSNAHPTLQGCSTTSTPRFTRHFPKFATLETTSSAEPSATPVSLLTQRPAKRHSHLQTQHPSIVCYHRHHERHFCLSRVREAPPCVGTGPAEGSSPYSPWPIQRYSLTVPRDTKQTNLRSTCCFVVDILPGNPSTPSTLKRLGPGETGSNLHGSNLLQVDLLCIIHTSIGLAAEAFPSRTK